MFVSRSSVRIGREVTKLSAQRASTPLRIGKVLFEQAAEIDAVAARIDEGIEFGLRRDREHRAFDAVAFDLERAGDAEQGAGGLEVDQRDRIAEHVVHPAHVARRRQRQLGRHQPQVVRIARPQHQPVLAEGDRPGVAVGGGVADGQGLHGVTVSRRGDANRAPARIQVSSRGNGTAKQPSSPHAHGYVDRNPEKIRVRPV